MQTELLTTLLVFLPSNNREIVKSALGFLKLIISHSFPKPIITPHLPQLVPALLARAHDHKNHFKVKVRHILERLIRRFGYDEVRGAVGEGEGGEGVKVLGNIKKRKDRAKRKRVAAEEAGEESDAEGAQTVKGTAKAGDAFEDVLYGSESEIEDSDDEGGAGKKGKREQGQKGGKKEFGARLRGDDEQPMDLLSGAASRVTSTSICFLFCFNIC
jgi:ribosomal RNA-processing protein 12